MTERQNHSVRTELEKVTLYRHKDGNRHAHDAIHGQHEGCEIVGEFVRVDDVMARLYKLVSRLQPDIDLPSWDEWDRAQYDKSMTKGGTA